MSVNINEFDNEKSILYKWSMLLKIPPELIIVEKVGQEYIYHNAMDKIKEYLIKNNNILSAHEKFPTISVEDLAMIYTLYNSSIFELSKIVEDINSLYKQENINIIRDVGELRLRYEEWGKKIKTSTDKIFDELDYIAQIHDILSEYKSLDVTDIKVTNITVSITFKMLDNEGKLVEPSIYNGVEIFNKSEANKNLPYIKYISSIKTNDKFLNLFKVYTSKTTEEIPNYKNIIPESDYKEQINSFIFIVWSGEGDIQKATKESFLKGVYDLSTNNMSIKIHSGDKDIIDQMIKHIANSFSIIPSTVENTYISGEFSIYDIEIKKFILSDMIFNDDILKTYFYIKETTTPLALKKKFKIFFRSEKDIKSSLTFSIEQKYIKTDEYIKIKGGKDIKYISGIPYLKVKISRADNIKTAEKFIQLFSRLMMYYKQNSEETEQIYKQYIPELEFIPEKKEIQVITSGSRIKQLKYTAPDIFVTDYARKCQKNSQPIIIPLNEKDEWETKFDRRVMAFPPDKPEIYIGCPDDEYPHPGVILNNELSNKDIYPCLPCCFKDDQMSPSVNSNYNKCYSKGKEEEEEVKKVIKEKKVKEGHVIITGKIIKPGRYGDLPEDIKKLLSNYDLESGEFFRKGVPHTVNSLIHCVSDAIDPKYKNIKNKEKYVFNIRKKISKNTKPSLLKQELYDYSDEEIINELNDPDVFLDPNKFYRALEEYYNVNIYVFGPTNKSNRQGEMVLPRFKLFYSRVPRNRKSILIFRTMGSESDSLKFAQCELIIEDKKDQKFEIFSEQMTNYLHNTSLQLNRIITWELVSENNKINVLGRDNIYSTVNYFNMISNKATRQLIDGYGKLRGLIFPSNGEEITMIIHSSQPENIDSTTDIIRCKGKTSIKAFGEPIAITLNEDNLVDGYWYQILDIVYGIYIPIIPKNKNKGYDIGPTNPYSHEGLQIVSKLKKLQRDLNYIKQILVWLFSLSKMNNVSDFMSKNIFIGDTIYENSENIYDFTNIGFTFPKVKTVKSGIRKIGKLVPTVVTDGKIYIYSRKFYNGLEYLLTKYNHENSPIKVPTEIYRESITADDFTKQPFVAVFVNENDLKTWLNSINKITYKNIIIDKKLSLSNETKVEPYIYSDPEGNVYMIQNVINGERLRAINVANYWKLNKINLGFNSESIEEEDIPNHVIYVISPSFNPIVSENNAGESTDYVQILSYRPNKYAAMIKLI